jgi:hypothetical protein
VVLGLVVSVLAAGMVARAFLAPGPSAPAHTPTPPSSFGCPPGTHPDRAGSAQQERPPQAAFQGWLPGAAAFDSGSGRIVLVPPNSDTSGLWTFNVCTNTWAPMPWPDGDLTGWVQSFVYNADSRVFVAFEAGGGTWTLDPDLRSWTRQPTLWAPSSSLQAVYRDATGLLVVRDPVASELWTYDVETDTWAEIDQGAVIPPGASNGFSQLLAYDASVDRLILYVPGGGGDARTWEFEMRSGSWTRQPTVTPQADVVSGHELVYDQRNEVSVLFSDGVLAAYDASSHRWQTLSDEPANHGSAFRPVNRTLFAMAYDSVNGRVVVMGGGSRINRIFRETGDVLALDVGTGEWTELVPTREGSS